MVNQPNQDMQGLHEASGRLVLPAPPDEGQYLQSYRTPIRPEQLIRRPASPDTSHGLFTRLINLGRRDPAYWILSLAIVLVLVASVVFVALGATTLFNTNNNDPTAGLSPASATSTAGAASSLAPTPTTAPTQSTQVVIAATPTFAPTPTATPVPALTVQIVSVPAMVANNSKPHVSVRTSEPGVTVKLQVTYNVTPFFYTSAARTTSNAGTTTLTWSVKVLNLRGAHAQASLVVVAVDRTGHQATSPAITVTVV